MDAGDLLVASALWSFGLEPGPERSVDDFQIALQY